ncbi:MAG TPA: efflux RND transporter periplasmic adaptor subunit [Verrucomicrobiota bacterium]|nr:efflux RND transporter periplasmic adaptor subunit [Verrucomicrobiota bacterium]
MRANFWLVLGLLVAGSGCKREAPPTPGPPIVEVTTIIASNVPITREWVGTLEGQVNATILAQVTGYLLKQVYREGSFVTNGQVLFQIDPGPFEAALARAQAQEEEARAHQGKTQLDVDRYTPLAKTQAIAEQELDNAIQANKGAIAQVASAVAAVQEAKLNLGFTTIRSPVDGVAGLAQAQVGNLLGPSSGTLTTVSQINPIRAYFSVSQQTMMQVQEARLAAGEDLRTGEGPPLQLVLAAGGIYPHPGRVRFADNQVDVKTGTIRVVGLFPNDQQLLVPGMFARVRALMGIETNALIVPQRAVTEVQGRYLVAVVGADKKVSIQPVSVGERLGPLWAISGKLKAGDQVVAEGIQKVRDGVVVDPVPFGQKVAATATPPSASAKP